VLIYAQDRCTVCAECSMDMEIFSGTPDGSCWGCWSSGNFPSVYLEIELISTQDRCTVCTECIVGSEIALGNIDQVEAHLDPFGSSFNLSARKVHDVH
jgi:hypothetical protein